MGLPARKTRRGVAYWAMGVITSVMAWLFVPGDIGQVEQGLAIVILPSVTAILIAFITGETYSDHSARKHKDD